MEEERKAIIIKEIVYWKQNNLLPDRYCDFLLALYTQGKQNDKSDNSSQYEIGMKEVIVLSIDALLIPFLILRIFVPFLNGFGSFFLLIGCLAFSGLVYKKYKQDRKTVSKLTRIIYLLTVLLSVLNILALFQVDWFFSAIVIFLFSVSTGVSGYKRREKHLIYTAGTGMILLTIMQML